MDSKSIGTIIKNRRNNELCLTQTKVAAKCGMSRDGYRLIETGVRYPRRHNLIRICKVLGLNIQDIEAKEVKQE